MPTSAQLRQKSMGFIQAIDKMSEKMKEKRPTGQYSDDYNNMRRMVLTVHPELIDVMPPELEIAEYQVSGRASVQHYDEIAAYCQQIVNMLP